MPTKHSSIIIEQDEDGVFIITCPSLTGCRSYGNTIDEAIENITEAIGACLEDDFSGSSTECMDFCELFS
ncbi:MAG: type II toxin-antitoxin system HicB family antitoxin [Thermodesulfobacteriota bacterium]